MASSSSCACCGEPVSLGCLEGLLPRCLKAEIKVPPTDQPLPLLPPPNIPYCACWDHLEIALTYDEEMNRFEGTTTACEALVRLRLYCQFGAPKIELYSERCGEIVTQVVSGSGECLLFVGDMVGGCCNPHGYQFVTYIRIFKPEGPCVVGTYCVPCNDAIQNGGAHAGGSNSVRYGLGHVVYSQTDIASGGFGVPWSHTRSFTSSLEWPFNLGNGYNWQVSTWPYAVPRTDSVVIMGHANAPLWFDRSGSTLTPRANIREQLTIDNTLHEYTLLSLDGTETVFSSVRGGFESRTSPGGSRLEVVSRAANGFNVQEMQQSYTESGSAVTESILYEYDIPASPGACLTSITLKRQVDAGPWENVSRVLYTYYDTKTDLKGFYGDLKTVTTQTYQADEWVDTGTTYYRYYVAPRPGQSGGSSSSSSSSSSGSPQPTIYDHMLKFVLEPAAFQKMVDAELDPLTADDFTLSQFADYFYAYKSDRTVFDETVSSGSLTHTFGITNSIFPNDFNKWHYKTIETRPDGAEIINFSNYAGMTMLQILKDGADIWYEFWHYTSTGLVDLHAQSSAISGYDEAEADLLKLNLMTQKYQYLRDFEGLITLYTRHEPTGYVLVERLRHGQLGACVILRENEYIECCTDGGN